MTGGKGRGRPGEKAAPQDAAVAAGTPHGTTTFAELPAELRRRLHDAGNERLTALVLRGIDLDDGGAAARELRRLVVALGFDRDGHRPIVRPDVTAGDLDLLEELLELAEHRVNGSGP